jgi:hypothetical protein
LRFQVQKPVGPVPQVIERELSWPAQDFSWGSIPTTLHYKSPYRTYNVQLMLSYIFSRTPSLLLSLTSFYLLLTPLSIHIHNTGSSQATPTRQVPTGGDFDSYAATFANRRCWKHRA